jgi:phenylalanine-4-hydroxylase
MHTDRAFAETLVRFGECARTACELAAGIGDSEEQLHRLSSMIRAMARFFWFTIEFGLMWSPKGLKVYGSGLLTSFGEIEHAIESGEVQRFPLQLEWAVNQAFEINHFQPLLFMVDSFDQLYDFVGQLDHWLREGRLNNVAPGEPRVDEHDLDSFLHAAGSKT